jgi:ELWxxDGT repeat protein
LLTPFDGGIAFSAFTPATGRELWRTGAVPGGARLVADACPGSCGLVTYIGAHSGRLYFNAAQDTFDSDPWVSDGTVGGTRRLVDVEPGTLGSGLQHSFEAGGQVYLVLATPSEEPKLWRTDGTPTGTVPAFEILDGIAGFDIPSFAPPTAGGRVYFWTLRPGEGRRTLMVFDATTGATSELRSELETSSATALPFEPLGESLLFVARSEAVEEPWVSDGTAAGTRSLHRTSPSGYELSG